MKKTAIQTAAALMGRKGGKKTGPTKARTTEQARKAVAERWRQWRQKNHK